MDTKKSGIILTVIGGAIAIWVFTRITSVYGKLHSWEPPFTEYETTTIVGAWYSSPLDHYWTYKPHKEKGTAGRLCGKRRTCRKD